LDVLRGLAALAVVFWHWQHFFFVGTQPTPIRLDLLPLSAVLAPLYTSRWLALDIFFSLSGFIFYWLYARPVAAGAIPARDFFVLRLSRLYPLHFATLLIVAAGQWWFTARTGGPFVYGNNDAWHFVLNVLFAPSWGLERGFSFNGPVWSVSVEMLLYALFFVLCRTLPVRAPLLLALSAAGFFLVAPVYLPAGRGMGSFFLGGCMCLAWHAVMASPRARLYGRLIAAAGALAWLLTLAGIRFELRPPLFTLFPAGAEYLSSYWTTLALFPLTILWLALTETVHPGLGRRWAWLGDVSYASYLLHFPLQMLTMALLMQTRATMAIFYSAWLMVPFFAVLIALSVASHRWFEVPAQRALRQRLLSAAAARARSGG
jgi:peptidoglycan/LPS O-acetylase OafA/YrhL